LSLSDQSDTEQSDTVQRAEFERVAMPHLDAAYRLARWLVRHDQDAEDAVQEAFLRAFQFFRGEQTGRAWLLQIVRNTCYTNLARRRSARDNVAAPEALAQVASVESHPGVPLEQHEEAAMLRRALDALPVEFREAIVLRELEGLSYKEIARIADVPIGTVMSRLARGREQLHEILRTRGSEG